MRILLLIDSLGMGGAERQLALLASHLPTGVERRVWGMGGGPFVEHLQVFGVDVVLHPRKARFDASPAASLWRQLRTWKPDLVHSWGWMSTFTAGPMCRILGIPLIDGTIRTGARQRRFFGLKQFGMKCSRLVVANTQAGLCAWGVDPQKGRVVMNGFDPARLPLCESPVAQCGPPGTVVMTGRMEPEKDFATLIGAARMLSQAGRYCRLVLVGDGSQREALKRKAQDLVEAGLVEFPGPSIEVISVVRQAHVGVLMTTPALASEGCSNSILEYMACGLPVVSSDGGGNREVVLDGVTGFVVPAGDATVLAERLIYLLDHPVERASLGAAGKARIASDFSLQAMVRGFLALYSEALS